MTDHERSPRAGQSPSVQFLDLGAANRPLEDALLESMRQVLQKSAFVLGPAVDEFEAAFASYVGRRHCVALTSGTAALHLALLVAGIKPGDEVITTPLSWISTTWAISYCNATPVFVDVEEGTGNLDPRQAEQAISKRTTAILPVDLYGNPCQLDRFGDLASARGLKLIDDACQAHGAALRGEPVGSRGDLACFSFYPGKNLGALGEGGAVVTDDPDLDQRLRQLRDHAQSERHHHVSIGFNYRMDGLQGAALKVKLPYLEEWNHARRKIAARYLEELAPCGLELPEVTPGAVPNWHLFVIHVNERDEFRRRLADCGIETAVHYPVPIHLQPAYRFLGYGDGDFPTAERFADTCVSLPMSPFLSREHQDAVIDAVSSIARQLG